jgi:hypothetical protein
MEQLILHLVGDYLTQSDWMAQNKTKASWPAAVHAFIYSVPFWLLARFAQRPYLAFAVIFLTHFLIDRFRLARYVVWAKNWLAPRKPWYATASLSGWTTNRIEIFPRDVYRADRRTAPFYDCSETGYPSRRPAWLAVWLFIVADNTIHLVINYAALRWL